MVRRVLTPETARKVAEVLEGVVSEKGTAPLANITGYQVAGKTGTSQKVDPRTKRYSKRNYVALFVGFAPVDKPRLVILVMIDEPRGGPYGGVVAGPVFREVGAWVLNHLRINPQLRLVKRAETPETREVITKEAGMGPGVSDETAGLLPDFRGQNMRAVLKAGRGLGLKVALEGTGVAVKQTPRPGSSLRNTTSVKVNFRPPT
jgi:cell division protein FtsI (penicillin-binding protein 3)